MSTLLRNRTGIEKIDVAIVFIMITILVVVAVPRYIRYAKAAEAKSLISTMKAATEKVIQDLYSPRESDSAVKPLPQDQDLIQALRKELGGKIPCNPFTRKNHVEVKHYASLKPCDCLDPDGGWVWNLISPPGRNKPQKSSIWLNSDTVNMGNGNGESCIQP